MWFGEQQATADCAIRVLHLLGTARSGGAETFVLNLARHIDRTRFHLSVCIMGQDGPIADELRAAKADVYILGAYSSFSLGTAIRYFRYVRWGRFHILHANIGGRSVRYLARVAGCRVVFMHVHGLPDEWVEELRHPGTHLEKRIKRAYYWGASQLIVNAHAICSMLTKQCPLLSGHVSVVPHGVNLDRFRPVSHESAVTKALRREIGLMDREPVIGFVGRLVRQKGLPYLLAAASDLLSRYHTLRVVIVGDGPLRSDFEAATERLGARRILFLGERRDVPQLMALFDVIVVPSEWEAFGIVNLEAMASAVPIVAFDIDGIPEVVKHGETGLLVPHRDSRALVAAIGRLLDDSRLREQMGLAGRRTVEERFDVQATTRTIESLYETAMSSVTNR
jgi:glycosyltransferase involved in cell wall biosynthesis